MNIAIIPARGGSQRIRLKNIKLFKKKPILEWTIKTLKKSKIFDLIVLSSDHLKILQIGKKNGCDLLFKRNKKLSSDSVPTIKVIKDVIQKLKENNLYIEKANIACIYPCNPLIKIQDLKKGFSKLKNNNSKFVIAISELNHSAKKYFVLKKKNKIVVNKNKIFISTQKLSKTYFENGQFCIAKTQNWIKSNNVFQNSIGVKIPSWRVSDIDDINDWKKAEVIFEILRKNNEI